MTAAPSKPASITAATTAKPQVSSKPQVAGTVGEGDEKPNRRPSHPLVGNSNPALYPFAKAPGDYDSRKHAPLKKSDFKDEAVFYEFRADELERKAKSLREVAASIRSGGGNAAKQLVKMTEKIEEVKAKLKAQGIDPEELLKKLLAGG